MAKITPIRPRKGADSFNKRWAERGSTTYSPEAKADLAKSGISLAAARELGIKMFSPDEVHSAVGVLAPGLGLPCHDPNGEPDDAYWRIKILATNPEHKYKQRAKTHYRLGFAPVRGDPQAWVKALPDTSQRIYITEGEKKGYKAGQEKLLCIYLGGVTATVAHYGGDDKPSEPLHDYELVQWHGREVAIVFDSDALTKIPVQCALIRECRRLAEKLGALPKIIELPPGPDGEKVGLDDYLVAHGINKFLALPVYDWTDPRYDSWAVSSDPKNTDLGNATRFCADHGETTRYVHDFKQWYLWDGHYWRPDSIKEVYDRAARTVRAMHREVATHPDRDKAKALSGWAVQSESATHLRNMLDLAANQRPVRTTAASLDINPWLVGMKNGVLDLKTGQPVPARQEDHITKLLGCEFDPAAKCPRWERFVREVMGGDAEMVEFLRRFNFYLLTGDTREQCLFFLSGSGANGKSTYTTTIKALLGDYGQQIQAESLMLRDRTGANNDLARLHGARMALAAETEEGQRLAESLIKQLTGQDVIAARFLFQEFFEYTPQFKVVMVGNHRPVIRGDDHAIWRRIRLVPFDVTFPPAKQDRALGDRLMAELPGILNWALAGREAWLANGLTPPKKVLQATAEYRAESDPLENFFADRCERSPEYVSPARELYGVYSQWAANTGHKALSETMFFMRLKDRGFKKKTTKKGMVYVGLRPARTGGV